MRSNEVGVSVGRFQRSRDGTFAIVGIHPKLLVKHPRERFASLNCGN